MRSHCWGRIPLRMRMMCMSTTFLWVCVRSLQGTDVPYRLTFGTDPVTLERRRTPQFRTEMIRCPQMSSIKYHEPSHKMLLTSREPDHSCGLYLFSPLVSEEPRTRGQWLLGESESFAFVSTPISPCFVSFSPQWTALISHVLGLRGKPKRSN